MESISYKSFCWNIGTTSFRTKNFNRTIEIQLSLLDEFWKSAGIEQLIWQNNEQLQEKYYLFLKAQGFVKGDAPNKAKDARQKTSGLEDLGLIDSNRKLTAAGEKLLNISRIGDFSIDNDLFIAKDSFIYLKQLLKTSCKVDENTVRPLIVLLYVLSKLEYLTREEFTYLLPLCVNVEVTNNVIEKIKELRNGLCDVDSVIIGTLLNMPNYQAALNLFLESDVTEELIMTIGFNRKSKSYDKAYYSLYNCLNEVFCKKDSCKIVDLYDVTKGIKLGVLWRRFLFKSLSRGKIKESPEDSLLYNEFGTVSSETEFKRIFFSMMHLFKAKATMHDYYDLNKRYLSTTDILLFEEDTIKLDIVPKQYFNSVISDLYNDAYKENEYLPEDIEMSEISSCLTFNANTIIDRLNQELGTSVKTIDEVYSEVDKRKYERLHHLIDTKFSDDKLLKLLDCFDTRDDSEIENMVTDNADIPTIFEYILGIIWYKISEYKGHILDYMKLSLDANLLPKTHAAGGEADIVYEYIKTENYPAHTLLIEATLADSTNQRRMEMEPVSRHLGNHLLANGNMNSYCVFVTNNLHVNVLSDFRSRKNYLYYDPQNEERFVESMKIIPLQISDLRNIISMRMLYKQLYNRFDIAYNSQEMKARKWYDDYVKISES